MPDTSASTVSSTRFDYVLAAEFSQLERARMVSEDYDGGRDEYRSFRATQFSAANALVKRVAQLEHSTLADDAARLAQKIAAAKNGDAAMIADARETLDLLRRRALQEKIDSMALASETTTLANTFIILTTAESAIKTYPQPHRVETENTKKMVQAQFGILKSHDDALPVLDEKLAALRDTLQQMEEYTENRARAKAVAGYIKGGTGLRTAAPRTATFTKRVSP
ncbi:MAG: hypothetical protein K0R10_1366 [Alphaproteobacteria bacterium]|jgi:hypothetical protein|nr:hypothetical protein [Alphaproteobacteria bacterium]